MCTTNIYTYVYPDGRKESIQQPSLCSGSRHGRPCPSNVLFQHPAQLVQYGEPVVTSQQLPPTPTYTPRSSTPNYRSGDESDRSRRSSSASRRRSSGLYVNGQKVLDLDDRQERRSSRRERIVLVDNPPTPRTPPQTYTGPHTAPPSPNQPVTMPYVVDVPAQRVERPVFVDERPRVHIEVVDNHRSGKHQRVSSTSSHESRHSSRHSHSGDEEERRLRRIRREERHREEQEIREQQKRARIARANAEIAKRSPVPMIPSPRRTATFTRPVVEVIDTDAQMAEAVRRLGLEDKARRQAERAAEKAAREEDEAQRQRLMERMMPRRRATVGPGSRRHRVMYDDGLYRWE